jgi:hypothetical protein
VSVWCRPSVHVPFCVIREILLLFVLLLPSHFLRWFDIVFPNQGMNENVVTMEIVQGDTLQGYLMKENPNGITKLWKRRWCVFVCYSLVVFSSSALRWRLRGKRTDSVLFFNH